MMISLPSLAISLMGSIDVAAFALATAALTWACNAGIGIAMASALPRLAACEVVLRSQRTR